MATRALLDLRLSVRPDGAVIAGWHSIWKYSWPRDSSWVAVALAETGHLADSFRILQFLRHTQLANGTWAARYWPSGSGPVKDGRPAELDAVGWVPWAVWSWAAADRQDHPAMLRQLAALWPMVRAAADAAGRSLSRDGLPAASMDYWEHSVQVTLGTAAPLLAGLRAAAVIAALLGNRDSARTWAGTAARLGAAIRTAFGRYGYNRMPYATSGADAAVTFLGPPFAVPSRSVIHAAAEAERTLALPNGGLRPGANWTGNGTVAWTAETAFFALFNASIKNSQASSKILSWLARHRTSLGALPEQVNGNGKPASVAPLAWTDAVVLLALIADSHQLPGAAIPAP